MSDRTSESVPKWDYKKRFVPVLLMFVPGLLYGSFIAIDYVGTAITVVHGKVIQSRQVQRKWGSQCAFTISTPIGSVTEETPPPCWTHADIDQTVTVRVRKGRITGSVMAMFNSIASDAPELPLEQMWSRPASVEPSPPFSSDRAQPFGLPSVR